VAKATFLQAMSLMMPTTQRKHGNQPKKIEN
jgi:hypothetical protein